MQTPASGCEHCVPCCSVPLHRLAETRVHVRLARCHQAQFQRGACSYPLIHAVIGQVRLQRCGVPMRAADHHGQPLAWGHAATNRPLLAMVSNPCFATFHCGQQSIECWSEHDPQHGPAMLDQRDVDGEFIAVADELLRAVERVDQPESSSRNVWHPACGRCLLCHHRYGRGQGGQLLQNDSLGAPIGDGHGGSISLVAHRKVGCVDLQDGVARFARGINDTGQQGLRGWRWLHGPLDPSIECAARQVQLP